MKPTSVHNMNKNIEAFGSAVYTKQVKQNVTTRGVQTGHHDAEIEASM